MTRRFIDALGLTDHERTLVEQRLDAVDERDLQRLFDRRAGALSAIGLLMRQTHETIAADLGRREYLR